MTEVFNFYRKFVALSSGCRPAASNSTACSTRITRPSRWIRWSDWRGQWGSGWWWNWRRQVILDKADRSDAQQVGEVQSGDADYAGGAGWTAGDAGISGDAHSGRSESIIEWMACQSYGQPLITFNAASGRQVTKWMCNRPLPSDPH